MKRHTSVQICLIFLLFPLQQVLGGTSQSKAADPDELEKVSRLIAELRELLGVDAIVRPRLVDRDPRLVSVRRSVDLDGEFDLRLERSFVQTLTDLELRAVVAHELGHVWIYTHHPFLQTEDLANRIARRAISTELLDQVYGKVAAFRGMQENAGMNPVAPSDASASAGLSQDTTSEDQDQ